MESSVSNIIELKHIFKVFPGVVALSDVSIEIRKGEVFGIVGENGAGKSTLVKILAGVYRMDGGEITIEGEKCSITSMSDAQRKGLSFIFQERNLAPFLSVQENLFAGRQPAGRLGFIKWRELTERAREILSMLRCEINPAEIVNRLSTAEQQIVEIGRALSFNSKVIVMDEPTASISDEEANTLFRIIRNIRLKGVTVIFISHRLKEVLEITDRVAVMRDGKIVKICKTDEETSDSLIRLMVGRDLKNIFVGKRNVPGDDVILSVRELSCPGVFKDISFDLRRGEILGFAGLIGAKRTEVLRAIFGLQKEVHGEVYIEGRKVEYADPIGAMKMGISYLSEDRIGEGIFPFLSVEKNISIATLEKFVKLGFVKRKSEIKICGELVSALNIKAPNLSTLLMYLSGGNQQKTIIARGLLRNPKIFLLDEPTAGIDVGAKFEIYGILKNLSSKGVGILFVSSELNELLGICHRIIVMCQGRITAVFDAKDANQEDIMAKATAFT
ncbi:MAG: sugar ABC transporter ATP-binding protein [Thermodesulfovibrionales bacterium]